jgi:hypothetical protein
MSQLQGVRGQSVIDELYVADGTIADAGVSQLILPRARARSYLMIQNQSAAQMWFEIGGARATVTISNGELDTFTVTNGGFGYIQPPLVRLLGGGPPDGNAGASLGAGLPSWDAPKQVGEAVATIAGGIVTSIAVSNPGGGYLRAPYVLLESTVADAYGCADPFFDDPLASGVLLNPDDPPLIFSAMCPTGAVAVYCPDADAAFACRFMY